MTDLHGADAPPRPGDPGQRLDDLEIMLAKLIHLMHGMSQRQALLVSQFGALEALLINQRRAEPARTEPPAKTLRVVSSPDGGDDRDSDKD
jgi:hypothetical protein